MQQPSMQQSDKGGMNPADAMYLLSAMQDPQSYQAARQEALKIDPSMAHDLPAEYNQQVVQDLLQQVQSAYPQLAQGAQAPPQSLSGALGGAGPSPPPQSTNLASALSPKGK